MLLTGELVDQLHAFRVGMMMRSTGVLKDLFDQVDGAAIGTGYATFAGDGSPTTQVYGIGHRDSVTDLTEVDEFYNGRTSNWELIVTPFTSSEVLKQASELGYVADHFETVLAQIGDPKPLESPSDITIEEITGDLELWSRVSEAGWMGFDEPVKEVSEIGKLIAAYPSRRFLGFIDGQAAATASLVALDGKFMFAGASTMPKFRGRGLQTALTHHRLAVAGKGSLVQVVALPGSQSHRNLQRIGFEPLYSKLVMFRHRPDSQS